MAAELIGIGGLAAELKPAYSRRLLSRFRQTNIFNKHGMKEGLPARSGKNLEKRRFESLPTSTTVLVEGSYAAEINGTWSSVTATISQYGQWAKITDVAEMQSFDRIVPEYVDNFRETMAEVLDTLTRDVIVGGTNVQYASTAGSRAQLGSGMYINLAELREATRTLKRANAKPVAGEGGRYVGYIHPDGMYDLQSDAELIDIYQFAAERGVSNPLFEGSFKDLPFGVRLYETTNAKIYPTAGLSSADVHALVLHGEEYFMVTDFDTMPPEVITKERGSAGTSDPLNQISTVGYKCSHGAAILNQNLGVRIEYVASTANAR